MPPRTGNPRKNADATGSAEKSAPSFKPKKSGGSKQTSVLAEAQRVDSGLAKKAASGLDSGLDFADDEDEESEKE
jgi:hypothetical protein